MWGHTVMSRKLLNLSLGIVLVICAPLRGDLIEGSSSADFIDVGLELDLLTIVGGGVVVDADLGDLAPASGTALPTYGDMNQVLGINIQAGNVFGIVTVADVSAGTATSAASSTIDGLVGSRTTQATHTIENLDLSIADLPLLVPDLISITADALTVTSAITGDFGALVTAGSLEVTNLRIFVSGLQVGAALNGIVPANTGIDLKTVLGGVKLMFNEQVTSGDGVNMAGLTTSAISLQLTDVGVAGVGTLNGSVVVAPTQASATAAVPEPSSCLLLGMAGLGVAYVRRRRIAAANTGDVAC